MTNPLNVCQGEEQYFFWRNENSDAARIQVGKSSEIKEERRMRLIIFFAEQVIVVVLVGWIVVDVLVK